jgi:ribosomal protein S18 acetylase RimI-like enzyme
MTPYASFKEFKIYPLTRALADKYALPIISSLNQIPLTDTHSKEKLLSDIKGERKLYAKWDHSLIALTEANIFAGVIIGYERKKEQNSLYDKNCIYLNDFAVSSDFQKKGLGKALTNTWIEDTQNKGFMKLDGKLRLAVQTNKAKWNSHVQRLYESSGFKKIGEKGYENRTDNVYFLDLEEIHSKP